MKLSITIESLISDNALICIGTKGKELYSVELSDMIEDLCWDRNCLGSTESPGGRVCVGGE